MMQELQNYATNMGPENIPAGMDESPEDQRQLLGRRPTPRLAQHAVPGAYRTGPFMHPGGAVTGAQ